MNAGSVWSIWDRVARYLLFVTVGLLAIDAAFDVVPPGFGRRLTLIVVGALLTASVGRYGSRYQGPSPQGRSGGPVVREGRWTLLVLLGLAVVGAGLRAYALGAPSFWFDEAITANAAIALLERGTPTFPSGYTYWRGFPHTLAVAGSMAIFGTGEAAARLPSVVFGVGTIVATYWLGRQVGGPTVGLVAAGLLTFATWEIAWSRQARMYQLFQLLYTLTLSLLFRVSRPAVGNREVGALAIVGVLAALTHPIGYVLLPVGITYLGGVAAAEGRLTRAIGGGLAAGSIGFLLAIELAGGGVTVILRAATASGVDYASEYLGWVSAEFGVLFLLGLIGAAVTFYRGRFRAGALLVLAVVPAAAVLSFRTELFATRYLYFGLPVLFVWVGTVVRYVAVRSASIGIARRWWRGSEGRFDADGGRPSAQAALGIALALVVTFSLAGGVTVSPRVGYDLGPNAPQPDFAGAYQFVNEHRAPGDVIVAGWTAPGLYYAGGVDYWLAHDLAGLDHRWTNDGEERYSGAAPVRSADQLARVMATHRRGWIVLDSIAYARQSAETQALLAENATRRYDRGGMTVFHWRTNASTDGEAAS